MRSLFVFIVLTGLLGCSTVKTAPTQNEPAKYPKKRYAADCYPSQVVMINELGLTDEQASKIIEIDERYSELYLIRKNETDDVRLQHKAKIDAVLTKQQRKKFQEIFQERFGKK